MNSASEEFARLEYEGWQRVAAVYDSVWASLTRRFIDPLLHACGIGPGMSVLDVACGPGYAAAAANLLGAGATGIDFSSEMIARAARLHPGIEFLEGDAQALPFPAEMFHSAVINFGLLHVPDPGKALAECYRVLQHHGVLGFTLWARPSENPGGKLMEDAIGRHADPSVKIPEGPPYFLFADRDECNRICGDIGFSMTSMTFETLCMDWEIPTANFYFEAELHAGVRTAALLSRQPADRLERIRADVEAGVRRYPSTKGFTIPMAAYVVTVRKG